MSGPQDGERQRVAGFSLPSNHRSLRTDATEQRVAGIPRGWLPDDAPDLFVLRHPIRWVRWRLERRRLGPYAPKRPLDDDRGQGS